MTDNLIKLNIGSGRQRVDGFTNIDMTQIIDGNNNKTVDIVMNIEKEPLPYQDDSVDEILIDNVLEHLVDLRFVMNECHRVLKKGCVMRGCVPMAGTDYDFKDPTHVRHFIPATFGYFCGESPVVEGRPAHPKYADYGYKSWIKNKVEVVHEGLLIDFELTPNK